MLLFSLIFSINSFGSIVNSLFTDLDGHWEGKLVHSSSITSQEYININVSLDFENKKGEGYLLMTFPDIENPEKTNRYFFKKNYESDNHILISDRFDEDVAEVAVKEGNDRHTYILRGLLKPKNDQITISLEPTIASISITDQFSSNVTLISLNQEFKNQKINTYIKFGLSLSVVAAILVGLYKMSDLADVIPHDEGQTALAIKQMAQAQERAQKLQKEKDTNKKGKSDTKPKTE
ncbi:hypothetical protein TRFO_19517 [Tritrichomonas foetus]|uniref:Uncharacterized protein n=1 Tax=Tritrichomonas foetus TaxID=1144522 RepID=A0A1J4KIV6_9EUKA|nr:hypothetical protein TRFO_19517 [Tritrichomonas foetus]|eukprot:OHT11018.1 hypothetical protein TRFO_19517 [Tritrichomonas foetus]